MGVGKIGPGKVAYPLGKPSPEKKGNRRGKVKP